MKTASTYQESELEKLVKPRFYGVSNEDLIGRANNAADFNWDNEAVELMRRHKSSNGAFDYEMRGNRLVITANNQ